MKTLQIELETLYNRFQQIPMLTKLFEEMEIVEPDEEIAANLIALLVHMAIQKRMPIGTALGILTARGMEMQDAVELVELCVSQGAIDLAGSELVVVIEPNEETQQAMDSYMFPPPMVVKPLKIKRNTDSGYLMTKKSVMSKRSHTSQDVCLDVLNILNSFEYTLNLDVLNTSSQYPSLQRKKQGESQAEYSKRFKQWKRFDLVTRELIENHYKDVEAIWFTHQYDKRGRIYCRGYNFNYQGSEWNKALIQMKKELVNESSCLCHF